MKLTRRRRRRSEIPAAEAEAMAFPPLFSGDKTVKFRVIAARPPPWTMVRVRFPIGAGLGF